MLGPWLLSVAATVVVVTAIARFKSLCRLLDLVAEYVHPNPHWGFDSRPLAVMFILIMVVFALCMAFLARTSG